jgi:hypothetical protein
VGHLANSSHEREMFLGSAKVERGLENINDTSSLDISRHARPARHPDSLPASICLSLLPMAMAAI